MAQNDGGPIAQAQTCHKVRALADIQVVLDYPRWTVTPDYEMKGETREEYLRRKEQSLCRWASDINEFLRDHRSRDAEQISIDREYADVCSACGEEWEPYRDEGTNELACVHCGAICKENPDG